MTQKLEAAAIIIGIVAIIVGLAQIYRPAAWIGAGVLLVAFAVLSRRGQNIA